jgi:glycosyltransferase involved in cell wall biosynthesis
MGSKTYLQDVQKRRMKLSVVIPVYNEQSTIGEVIDRVLMVKVRGFEKEVIISDDGSADNTPAVIHDYSNKYPDTIKVYTSPINLGKGAAVRLGLNLATGDVVLVQDADLELNPEEYPQLLAPILRGETNVVYGSRFRARRNQIPVRTRMSNWFLTQLTNLLYGSRLTDMATAYKVFRIEVIKGLTLRSARFEFEPEVTAKLLLSGQRIVEVPISFIPRGVQAGKKIGWIDGIEYVYTLLKYRFLKG